MRRCPRTFSFRFVRVLSLSTSYSTPKKKIGLLARPPPAAHGLGTCYGTLGLGGGRVSVIFAL